MKPLDDYDRITMALWGFCCVLLGLNLWVFLAVLQALNSVHRAAIGR